MNLFTLGHEISNWLSTFNLFYLAHFSRITTLSLFLGGIITGLNPCLLSLLPICISYLDTDKQEFPISRFFQNLLFSFGTVTIFSLIAILTVIIGHLNTVTVEVMRNLSAFFFVITGLNLLGITPFVNLTTNSFSIPTNNPIIKCFLLGVLLGLNNVYCSTPMLISTFSFLSTIKSLQLTLLLATVFTTGYTLPLFLLLSISREVGNFLKSFSALSTSLPLFAGCFLTAIGSFSIVNQIFYFVQNK